MVPKFEPEMMPKERNTAAVVSVAVIWLIELTATAVVLTESGLITLPLDTAVVLLALGGILFIAALAFVRYYSEADRLL